VIQIGQTSATIDTPIEHLMACHRRIEDRLETLERAAAHLTDDRAAAVDAIRKSIAFLDSSGVLHTRDEEESVFPRLRPRLTEVQLQYLATLEEQHRAVEEVYGELKLASAAMSVSDPIPDGLRATYTRLVARMAKMYRLHIESEDELLMRLARNSLDADQLKAISQEMAGRRKQTAAPRES
jgi:hemerythrin-like domain-containing protein